MWDLNRLTWEIRSEYNEEFYLNYVGFKHKFGKVRNENEASFI